MTYCKVKTFTGFFKRHFSPISWSAGCFSLRDFCITFLGFEDIGEKHPSCLLLLTFKDPAGGRKFKRVHAAKPTSFFSEPIA